MSAWDSADESALENAHLELWVSENRVSKSEMSWNRWTNRAEKLFGHNLDGDQDIDGYSLDYAYKAWQDGLTPKQYVAKVGLSQRIREVLRVMRPPCLGCY